MKREKTVSKTGHLQKDTILQKVVLDFQTLKFISISIGSIAELQTQLIISEKLKYTKDANELTNR